MRILTQDKKGIFNLNRFDSININDSLGRKGTRVVGSFGNNPYKFWELGIYKTEARAKQVLMEIFNNTSETFEMPEE